jgi:TfoX/Sxy family transcriptional regulator of competence genes
MACDEALVERIRVATANVAALGERRMFGGVCFTLNGNMFCGVVKDDLMVRLGEEVARRSLSEPHAREMDFTGRPLRGYLFVGHPAVKTLRDVRRWIDLALAFAETLPSKTLRRRVAARRPIRKSP